MKKTRWDYSVILAAIAAVAVLESVAMLKGIDGKLFSLSLAVIGALAGLKMRDLLGR